MDSGGDWELLGEEWRQQMGIDGTAGDAQDVEHPYTATGDLHPKSPDACLACGLGPAHDRHVPLPGPEGSGTSADVLAARLRDGGGVG